MIQLPKKISQAEPPKTVRNCGKNVSKIRWRHWRRRWNAWRQPAGVGTWFHSLSLQTLSSPWLSTSLAQRCRKRCGEGPVGKAVGPFSWTHGMLWHYVERLECSGGKYGPRRELFFLPHREGTLGSYGCSGV